MAHESKVLYRGFFLPTDSVLSYTAIGLVGPHISATLYHHFYRRDDILRRMLPGSGVAAIRRVEVTRLL
jgi:cytochrome b561